MMFDVRKAEKEMLSLKGNVTNIFSQLNFLDQSRLKYINSFLSSGSNPTDLEKLKEITQETSVLLEQFEDSFLKVMAYVLLLEKEGHRNEYFQDLLARYRIIEEKIKKLGKIRKEQIVFLSKIIELTSAPGRVLLQNFYRWRFLSSFKKEKHLTLVIIAVYQKNRKELEAIKSILENEKGKKRVLFAAAGAAWFVPVVGTLLCVAIIETYEWANQYSENYNKLVSLIS